VEEEYRAISRALRSKDASERGDLESWAADWITRAESQARFDLVADLAHDFALRCTSWSTHLEDDERVAMRAVRLRWAERALEAANRYEGEPGGVRTLRALVELGRARIRLSEGRAANAPSYEAHRRALALAERIHPPDSIELVEYLDLPSDPRDSEQQIARSRRAIAIVERHEGSESKRLPWLIFGLAIGLSESGRHDEAVTWLARALRIRETIGEQNITLVMHQQFLARELMEVGCARDALPLFEAAATITAKLDPVNHGHSLTPLAECLLALGRPNEALSIIDEAVRLYRSAEKPYGLPQGLATQALVLAELGRDEEARARAREAMAFPPIRPDPEGRDTAKLRARLHKLLE